MVIREFSDEIHEAFRILGFFNEDTKTISHLPKEFDLQELISLFCRH